MDGLTKQVFGAEAADLIAGIPFVPCPVCETLTQNGLCSSQCVRQYLALPEAERERLRQPGAVLGCK